MPVFMRSFQIYTVFSRNFKKILRILFFSKCTITVSYNRDMKTQKTKHKPYEKSNGLRSRTKQVRIQKLILASVCHPVFLA